MLSKQRLETPYSRHDSKVEKNLLGSVWRQWDEHKEGLRNRLNKTWHLGCCCVVVRGPMFMMVWERRGGQPSTRAVN